MQNPFLRTLTDERPPTFSLADIPGFPFDEYNRNRARYQEMHDWYHGTYLEETMISATGKTIERYPLRINPIVGACYKHAYTLFGESIQDDRPLVFPKVVPPTKTMKTKARDAESTLYQIWWENNGRSLQFENGLISQIFGGCVFYVAYDPKDKFRSKPIRIEKVHPMYFVGIPRSSDMFQLQEAWILKPITPREANEYGVAVAPDEEVWQCDHWTENTFDCTINGKNAIHPEGVEAGGNPYGFVPVVYIPHTRSTGFYGDNAFDEVRGIVKEYNLRLADFGDAVSVDSHSYLGMRNVNGAPQIQQLAPGLFAVNLGSTPGVMNGEAEPDLFEVRSQTASAPMESLVDKLYDQFRRDICVPPIADGEDEGSQRSGLTLAMRMWPLVSHTNTERVYWTMGLDLLNRMMLRILQIRGEGIDEIQTTFRLKEEWAPPLPRDREALVNEAVARMGSKLGSPQTLIELLGDVEDVEEEVKEMLDFWEKMANAEATQPAGMAQASRPPSNGQTAAGKPSPTKTSESTKE